MDKIIRFKIGEKTYELDAEDITFDEWDEFERVVGCALEDASRMKGTRGLIYLAVRREDPTFTFEDLGAVRPQRIETLPDPEPVEQETDERPPSAGGAPESASDSSVSAEADPEPPATAVATIHAVSGHQ